MSIKSHIEGIEGRVAKVGERGAVHVNIHQTPADDLTPKEVQQVKIHIALLEDPSGSNDLNIDGSVTPVMFSTNTDVDHIAWVDQIRLIFHSTNMKLDSNESRRFGPVIAPGLTNGLTLTAYQGGTQTEVFTAPVRKIGDFYTYVGMTNIGAASSIINDVDAIVAGTDYLMIVIDLPASIALFPGTQDRLEMVVQDDLSGIELFEVIYTGTQQAIRAE